MKFDHPTTATTPTGAFLFKVHDIILYISPPTNNTWLMLTPKSVQES